MQPFEHDTGLVSLKPASEAQNVVQATRGTRYTLVFCIIMIAGYVVKVCFCPSPRPI